MDPTIKAVATILATIVSVLGGIFYLDRKIVDLRREQKGDIKDLRDELGGEISAGRAESRSEFKGVRTELGDKIDRVSNGLGSEIKEVRDASYSAHTAIRQDLADIKIQQAAHTERLKCIESHLDVKRSED